MNRREYALQAIAHVETDRTPYTLGFDGGTDDELDRYYGSSDWRLRVQGCIRGVAGINTAAERQIDEYHTVDGFGSVWRLDERVNHLEAPVLATAASFDGIEWPKSEDFPWQEHADLASSTGPQADRLSVISIGWGLFEQTWRIRGFENVMADCVQEEDFYGELLDRLTELYLDHVARCARIPADGIMFGDDWGDQRGVIIGPERWRRFLKPRWARIYDAVHEQGKLAISHCCGSVADIMPDIADIGLDVLESVQPEPSGMNPFELKRQFGKHITFWGCLGSQSTIPFGTPSEIRNRVRELCETMGRGGGFILSPAKPIQQGTPVENTAAVVEAFVANNPSETPGQAGESIQ